MNIDASNSSYPALSVLSPDLSQDAHFFIAGILHNISFCCVCSLTYPSFIEKRESDKEFWKKGKATAKCRRVNKKQSYPKGQSIKPFPWFDPDPPSAQDRTAENHWVAALHQAPKAAALREQKILTVLILPRS